MTTSLARSQPGGKGMTEPSTSSFVSCTASCGFWRGAIFAVGSPARRWDQLRSSTRSIFGLLSDPARTSWIGITFVALAASAMRKVIVDGWRRKHSRKRDPQAIVSAALDDVPAADAPATVDVLALDEALRRLAELDARQAQIVELRFFGGLTLDEIAAMFGVSERTVKREWQKARTFLYHAMRSRGDEQGGLTARDHAHVSADAWRRICSVLDRLYDAPPAMRDAILEDACREQGLSIEEVRPFVDAKEPSAALPEEIPLELIEDAFGDLAQERPAEFRLNAGQKLGPYEIVASLGAGGMGEVYRASDSRLDRTVAIKVLRPHLLQSEEARHRFDREARAISRLNHPHVCTLYDVGHQDGVDFLVMEYARR